MSINLDANLPAVADVPIPVAAKPHFEEKMDEARGQKNLLEIELKCTEDIQHQVLELACRVQRLRQATVDRYKQMTNSIPETSLNWNEEIFTAESQLEKLPEYQDDGSIDLIPENEQATDVERRLTKLSIRLRSLAVLDNHLYEQRHYAKVQQNRLQMLAKQAKFVKEKLTEKRRQARHLHSSIDDELFAATDALDSFSKSIIYIKAAINALLQTAEVPQIFGPGVILGDIDKVRQSLEVFLETLKIKLEKACVGIATEASYGSAEEKETNDSLLSSLNFALSISDLKDPLTLKSSISKESLTAMSSPKTAQLTASTRYTMPSTSLQDGSTDVSQQLSEFATSANSYSTTTSNEGVSFYSQDVSSGSY